MSEKKHLFQSDLLAVKYQRTCSQLRPRIDVTDGSSWLLLLSGQVLVFFSNIILTDSFYFIYSYNFGADMVLCVLSKQQFIDEHTAKTVIQMVTYNSYLETPTYTEITFSFHQGGHYQVRAV